MTDLAARLESAEAGSRELSDAVLLACGWSRGCWVEGGRVGNVRFGSHKPHPYWQTPDGTKFDEGQRPSPTERVDDVIAMVLDGYSCDLSCQPGPGRVNWASVYRLPTISSLGSQAYAATPALALSAARVSAIRKCPHDPR
jgi:hypothetical protein